MVIGCPFVLSLCDRGGVLPSDGTPSHEYVSVEEGRKRLICPILYSIHDMSSCLERSTIFTWKIGKVCSLPAVCGDTLITTVLLVPVFALHSWVGAAGSYANVWAGTGSHTWCGSYIHLHLHLREKSRHRGVYITGINSCSSLTSCFTTNTEWGCSLRRAYPFLCHFLSSGHFSWLSHLHRQTGGGGRGRRHCRGSFTVWRHNDWRARIGLPWRRDNLDLQGGRGSGSASWFGLQGWRGLGVHHLLQPRRRRGALHLLQWWRLAWRGGGHCRDGYAARGKWRLLDYDFSNSGGIRRCGYRRRLGFDGAGAGPRGDLRQVQDDVGDRDVGDGVLLWVVMLRPGGAGRYGGGGCCRDHWSWSWSRGRGRRGGIHDFNRGLRRGLLETRHFRKSSV